MFSSIKATPGDPANLIFKVDNVRPSLDAVTDSIVGYNKKDEIENSLRIY